MRERKDRVHQKHTHKVIPQSSNHTSHENKIFDSRKTMYWPPYTSSLPAEGKKAEDTTPLRHGTSGVHLLKIVLQPSIVRR